jgi:hypothetical protein
MEVMEAGKNTMGNRSLMETMAIMIKMTIMKNNIERFSRK